ncbi:MAG: N-acetylmuramoyl-L-alanine amidase [Acidobacteria bacterium]|nr:MAG: N-acetylmuramoyl-L-alanine amidase [Acidobacteriota bacterium]
MSGLPARRRKPVALLLAAAFPAALLGAEPPPGDRRVEVSSDLTVVLTGGEISVEARPLEGEEPADFARRLARDPAGAQGIVAGRPSAARPVVLPFGLLADAARLAAVRALFPSDLRSRDGWLHVAVADEPLSSVASWFTSGAANGPDLARANGLGATIARRGTTVRIPVELLAPPFKDEPAVDGEEAPPLTFAEDGAGRHAVYRIRQGEALYSAVVVRFTGRLHAEDVIELALKIALRSGIDDVHAIPVGFPVKIPLAFLSEEYLPPEDPRAQELVRERAEAAQFSRPPAARGLSGVRVVLDAGHGGRDTGTIHGGTWESTYVYDVTCRLRKLLLERTRADVVMTSKEPGIGFGVPDRDKLPNRQGRVLLTNPPHALTDPTVGVNLRWYLANSLLGRPGKDRKPIPPDRTVFLSIHADSLHSSVRGAMFYVPGERFLRERFGRRGAVYASYREWREQPVVSFRKKDRVEAEGVSTRLAESLLGAVRQAGLPVHRFGPVRTHVVRGGREWVPAVLRYNRIPARVLVEISNLGNAEDRELTRTRAYRQAMAEALLGGILEYFGAEEEPPAAAVAAKAPRPVAEPFGPWPEAHGPWPETKTKRPAKGGGRGRG